MNESSPNEETLFEAVSQLPAEQRKSYLAEACGADAALRERMEILLRAHERVSHFMAEPVAPVVPRNTDLRIPLSERLGDHIGHYKLLQQIGEGGCGVVYVAEQEAPLRRKVALKIIKLGMDTRNVVARFEAERQVLAMMDHPNIAKVLDAGATETGRPFFVMELVRGVKITEHCDRHELSTRKRLELFIEVCKAVQYAHQKGIIHRDLKPSNILVTVNDPDSVGIPKVIDFGIAKATEGRLADMTVYTELRQFIGTPAYMSPEQATMTSLDIDTRSDIYSLGVLLYELLTSHTPFESKELMALGEEDLRRTIREKEPVRPSTRLRTMLERELTTTAQRRSSGAPRLINLLQGDLDWIVMKCLEKDRTRRYETANGLATDLRRHLNNETVEARPPTAAYRLQKTWRRHKLALTGTAVLTVVLVAGIGVSSWQAVEASRASNAERQQRLAAEGALYVANMNLAQQAWDQTNMGRLQQSLEATQSYPGRGFEWYYWQKKAHLDLKTLRGHVEAVISVAFSPDSQRIVTASSDNSAKVWEAVSGRELLTLAGHRGVVNTATYSPDGQRIVTGSDDNTAKVWEAVSGKELLTLTGHIAQVNSASYSPDGQRIVTGSSDRMCKVWDAVTGKELFTLTGHQFPISSVAFSPDGQRIASGSYDKTAKVWDASNGKELLTLGHHVEVTSVAFSPDSKRIVTAAVDNSATVWEAASGQELLTLEGHGGPISSVAFSPDGQRILTGSEDKTATVWEAAGGKSLITLKGHRAPINTVAFSPDGRMIATGSDDKTAKAWAATGASGLMVLMGHKAQVYATAFSPDGKRVVTGSEDKTAKVWDAASGNELLALKGHSAAIWSVAFSPNGRWIVTGSADHTAKVWDATSGQELITLTGHSEIIRAVAFSPDSQRIATGSWDHTAKVWEANTGRELLTFNGNKDVIWSVAFSPDGQRIITSCEDSTAKVWDANTGLELFTLVGHTKSVRSATFSPDGLRIVTGSYDQTAKVWEAATGRELLTLNGDSDVIFSVAFSPDSKRIIIGSRDKTARLWDAATGRELLTLKGHLAPVSSVAFSPDGNRIVTASEDHSARIWEAAQAGQVAVWREEERASAVDLAAKQRERTAELARQKMVRDRDSIKRWLIMAPIPLATGQTGPQGLDTEQIPNEGQLHPKAGESGVFGGAELKWCAVELDDYFINFNALLGHVANHSVGYAVCYIRSETEQHGVQLLVGSDDESKIYLNGKQIYRYPYTRGFQPEEDAAPDITLKAGLNRLVFKVVNEENGWEGSILVTDVHNNPVKGISVTLDPEGSEPP